MTNPTRNSERAQVMNVTPSRQAARLLAAVLAGAVLAFLPSLASAQDAADAAEQIGRQREAAIRRAMADAGDLRAQAQRQASEGQFDEALSTLGKANELLGPPNRLTQGVLAEIRAEVGLVMLAKASAQITASNFSGAQATLENYRSIYGSDEAHRRVSAALAASRENPNLLPPEAASPTYMRDMEEVETLLLRGRSQYVAGDLDGAESTFRRVEIIDPENAEAKGLLLRINQDRLEFGRMNRIKTRTQMLMDVYRAWQRPGILNEGPIDLDPVIVETPLARKLAQIIIPNVSFTGVELSRVVATLSQVSEEFDTTGIGPAKGVNIILLDPERRNPPVNISLRNLPLLRVMELITQSVGFQFEVQDDAVVVRPGGGTDISAQGLDTSFFPVSRSAISRMTGAGTNVASTAFAPATPAAPADPFAAPAPAPAAPGFGPAATGSGESNAIRAFLQSAGVDFAGVPGASIAYDGAQLIVTQTPRNIERIRNILNRYTDVKQVEIAARFMEVSEGALEELGFQWQFAHTRVGDIVLNPATGFPVLGPNGQPQYNGTLEFGTNNSLLRSLAQTVGSSSAGGNGQVVFPNGQRLDIPGGSASLPGVVDVGSGAADLLDLVTTIGDFDVSAVVRALQRKSGTDLLSEPKVTVLSGNPANIVVAQELIYPRSYSEAQSQVSGGSDTGGNSGVTITAATPQDFVSRNVGVELTVTPTVEDDDYSISLDLSPRVTEFEGFIEYGGPSIAISNNTVVRTPSGIFQPIFSSRQITTRATIWDGATVVLGGLTREEVRRVNDKVPWLGDVPLIGRLFRSEGEASQKRNLLIFVTANLVSPGGSPKRQTLRGVEPSSSFQNPTVVTPAGSASRRTTTP